MPLVSKPGARIADDHREVAGLAAGDDALDLLGGVVAAAVADGVRDRLLHRQLHAHDFAVGPVAFVQQRHDAVGDRADRCGSAGITMLNWQASHNGKSAVRRWTLASCRSSCATSCAAPGLGTVAGGESLTQLGQMSAQLELRLHLPLQRQRARRAVPA